MEPILSSPILQPYEQVIFLGDYFDDFYDTIADISNAAEWLKYSLSKPNRIHLFGTHDMWYRFPNNEFIVASGNTEIKSDVINSILTQKDWNMLRLYHYEQDFLLSHAGVHKYLIGQYIFKNSQIFNKYAMTSYDDMTNLNAQEIVDEIIKPATDEALIDASNNISNPWLEPGFFRRGRQPVGGIIWLDWIYEFEPIQNLNQIVGHTELMRPAKKIKKNSRNYCLDTKNVHIGILEDGKFSYIETLDVLETI